MESIKNLVEACVRNSDGSINVEATMVAFAEQVTVRESFEVSLNENIYLAVEQVFDTYLGQTLTIPTLTSLACNAMQTSPSAFAETSAAIGVFVRNNGAYKVAKGKGGGVSRVRDAAEKVAK